MSDHATDPLDALASPIERQEPRPSFARELRARLLDELGTDDPSPTVQLPERKRAMTATQTTRPEATVATTVTPYLTAHDAAAALRWYAEAFGAVETFRVVGDDGRLGHAEFTIGTARFMLSDEYPEIGVTAPTTLGGTTTALHLEVGDVDASYARAVDAGATSLQEPADQPHGARHGTVTDPFGHRWMLSQPIEDIDLDTYAERSAGSGFTVEPASTPAPVGGAIWAALAYDDARAGIRFLTDVLGFEERIIVPDEDDPNVIVHSQLVWPEGGTVQAATANRPGNVFSERPTGSDSLYVVTADPESVWERCQAAGVEVVTPPNSPDYAPDTMVFSIRDPEGNLFSFGSYAGEA